MGLHAVAPLSANPLAQVTFQANAPVLRQISLKASSHGSASALNSLWICDYYLI